MWPESKENKVALKSGLTTGCCATACCVAGIRFLFSGEQADQVSVTLPKGQVVELPITRYVSIQVNQVQTATTKDAGDDPDVTHGATIFVNLALTDRPGVQFLAAEGVGTVTRDGLLLAIGEPAINPVPRKMMQEHLTQWAQRYDYRGGFQVSVGVENGQQIALKTMNARLGILGGLSVLGTTGIVRPFSCAAYIASIHQGIDVATANGCQHLAASTGHSSEMAIKSVYQLPEMAFIEMGDFVGAVLKYLKKVPVKKMSICGGFGKMTKLAKGHLDLHSRASAIDFGFLANLAQHLGASNELLALIKQSNTTIEALKHCENQQIDLGQAVCQAALVKARSIVPITTELEIWAIDRQGRVVATANEVS